MNARIPRTATRAMMSVVVVSDSRLPGADYCSGFVAVKSRAKGTSEETLVVVPSIFIQGKKYLTVAFFDGVQSEATVVAVEESFALLTTAAHSGCQAVKFLNESTPSPFLPQSTFVLPPLSAIRTFFQRSYATLESLESYLENQICLPHSRNYFVIACEYSETTRSGISRLAASPVFVINNGTNGKHSGFAMGLVLQVTHLQNDRMKVAVTSSYVKKVLHKLCPPPPPQKGGSGNQKPGRRGSYGQKRKRANQRKGGSSVQKMKDGKGGSGDQKPGRGGSYGQKRKRANQQKGGRSVQKMKF